MNQMTPPPKLEIIPSSAPFSEAQRSWLNGFFAGLLSTDGPAPLSAEQGAAVMQGHAGDDVDPIDRLDASEKLLPLGDWALDDLDDADRRRIRQLLCVCGAPN